MQKLYTAREVALELGFSRWHTYNLIRWGLIKAYMRRPVLVKERELLTVKRRLKERGRYWTFKRLSKAEKR